MKRLATIVAAPLLLVAAAPALNPASIAGQYLFHHGNGLVDGTTYQSDDILEIVPVRPGAAYVRAKLEFYNGHQCDIAGIAHVEGPRLVYRPKEQPGCAFGVRPNGASMALEDANGECRANYCGARGGLDDDTAFTRKSRRPITYLAKLKSGDSYKSAVAEDGKR